MKLLHRFSVGLNYIDLCFFCLACVLNVLVYGSLSPIVLAFAVYLTGCSLLSTFVSGGVHVRRIYSRMFVLGFLASGVSSIYIVYLGDYQPDAVYFFDMSSNIDNDVSMSELNKATSSAAAIVIWGYFYQFTGLLGFPREQYVGVILNVLIVALSSVVALVTARRVYGFDPYRFKRLIILYSSCGLFWIFSGMHLRDAFLLLIISSLVYVWICFLLKPAMNIELLKVVGMTFSCSLLIGFFRFQFLYVPFIMAMAGLASLVTLRSLHHSLRWLFLLFLVAIVISAALFFFEFLDDVQTMVQLTRQSYFEGDSAVNPSGSLGMALIVNQPMAIRLFLGAAYLFVYPIPFWSGFQLESAYDLFKSINVVFFYFVIPLLVITVWQLWRNKGGRRPMFLFLLYSSVVFTLAVAGTTLETRHFGVFLAPLFVLLLLPNLRVPAVWRNYKQILVMVLACVAFGHLLWFVMKAV